MKKMFLIKPIYVILSLIFVLPVFSQEIIDHAKFRASYTFAYKTHPEQADYAKTDLMYLDMGDKATKFYSRYYEIRDSVKNDGLMKNLSPEEIHEKQRGYKRGTTPVYYQLYSRKKTHVTTSYISDGYVYEEPLSMPEWTVHNDTMTIQGYTCRRATTLFLGREWEVYFAPEIPMNKGPWKLWGLPGLIVQATDKDNFFLFDLKSFEQLPAPVSIIYIYHHFGKGNYTGKAYKSITKKKYEQYEKAYHNDVLAFTNFELGHEVKTLDGRPLPKIKHDYIPLEK